MAGYANRLVSQIKANSTEAKPCCSVRLSILTARKRWQSIRAYLPDSGGATKRWVSMTDDIAQWKKWVDVAFHDCANLMLSRDMFRDLHRMVEKNPKMQQPDYFYEYLADTYVAHTSMMLRKHIKVSKDSISLAKLAANMLQHKEGLQAPAEKNEFEAAVNRFRQSVAKVESFADRVVAHSDHRPPNHVPTHNEVNDAIDAMDSLVIQCWLAINGNYMQTCKPTVQYGWLQVFRAVGIET